MSDSENKPNTLKTQPLTSEDAAVLRARLRRIQRVQEAVIRLSLIHELPALMQELVNLIAQLPVVQRSLLLMVDEDQLGLRFGAISKPLENREDIDRLGKAYIQLSSADPHGILNHILNRKPVLADTRATPDSPVCELVSIAGFHRFFGAPLYLQDKLVGILTVELADEGGISAGDQELLMMLAPNLAMLLHKARVYSQTMHTLADKMHEMSIFQQIDNELNDTIALDTVFNMTVDWALRFTNASRASIALFDEETDSLQTMFQYGVHGAVEVPQQDENSITHRVALSGTSEMVPDVTLDRDLFVPSANDILSQMAIPVLREDRVVAVITLESKRLNAFTENHLNFVQNLASRAAVAIDNARLYTESERERIKLSHILGNIADIVIVVGLDERIVLMNQSAIAALQMYSDVDHAGQRFAEAVTFSPLIDLYRRARDGQENMTDELTLPNERVFHTKVNFHAGLGWILVMQDVTPYKEMDKLKSDLIATVSHDLKQPLSVMRGYLDLLQMKNTFNPTSTNFINQIDRAIMNMRQLIDDLLDLARIESGIDLDMEMISLQELLQECIEDNRQAALLKSMTIINELPDDKLPVNGEYARLSQIFTNLIGNAIKYTPPQGEVRVWAERRGVVIRVGVQDNGLGISPEDQAHIFERFYRVRRPETESIDGTGLGLAIVKSLVEAHHGKIRVESYLGQGSTFHVTLPVFDDTLTR